MSASEHIAEVMEYLLLAPDPHDLAAEMYGPTWKTEAVRTRNDSPYFVTRRLPHSTDLAAVLRPALADVLAHDGRSVRQSTASGFWLNSDGEWHPTTVAEIAEVVKHALSKTLTTAVEYAERSQSALTEHDRIHRQQPNYAKRAVLRDAAVADALRVVVISATYNAVAQNGTNFRSALQALIGGRNRKDAALILPDEVIADVAVRFVNEGITLGVIEVDGNNRIAASDVRDHWERTQRYDDAPLPLTLLYHGLDVAYGSRYRRTHWTLPSDEEADVVPMQPQQAAPQHPSGLTLDAFDLPPAKAEHLSRFENRL